ncbi:NAD(P)H-dependent oxidoreductase [Streptomyces sp. TRM 70361]|uniref:NADPH-dependent FMN reductase n=1 Tax=Streptomyces sp. TRM 70361 TaxID=3116553 RepID=UPI002E7C4E48|nr:NAD(P)H-dependent oxidoreductase [Streptomyces sp. TRM 70361]MEE1942689.1 NAD(P)H-dependent oxidoreductase [Streptomyces sp. TRM 70361]
MSSAAARHERRNDQYRLAVVLGSVREGRFVTTVGDWFARQAGRRDDVKLDVIDLARPDGDGRPFGERIDAADAVVLVVPEYNHSFPGPLKTAIDSLKPEWRTKPVGFVSYGGRGGGLRAVEQLRLVFAELHAVTVREVVSFHDAWSEFGPDGEPVDATAARAADGLLDQLAWWAFALRRAREDAPYPG